MHLDARSWFSFHDGVASPAELCAHAAELGFDPLGIADVDGCYGLIHHYQAAQKCGLHPVLGLALTDPRPAGAGHSSEKHHRVATGGGARRHAADEAGGVLPESPPGTGALPRLLSTSASTPRLRLPKRSILISPTSSTGRMSYCVTTKPLAARCRPV